MKTFVWTFLAVVVGIFAWSKLAARKLPATKGAGNGAPVDTGMFFGPNIDPLTGAYLEPGATPGTVAYNQAPIGPR